MAARRTDTLGPAREAQIAHYATVAQALVVQMLAGTDASSGLRDWSHAPPTSEDINTWKGATRWWGIEQRYRMACDRQDALARGRGPFWCPRCEEDPGQGWRVMLCIDCEWGVSGMTEALKRSLKFGRPLPCPRCRQQLIPGEHAATHMATVHARVPA